MRNVIAIAVTALLCAACGSEEDHASTVQGDWFTSYQSDPLIFASRSTTSLEDDEVVEHVSSKGPSF